MKLLMLCALLCVLALTRAAEKGTNKQVQQPDKDVSQLENSFLWWCSSGWSKYGGRCFHFVPHRLTWADAEKNCRSMGGHLASLRNKEEYLWVQHLIHTQTNSYPATWIGASTLEKDTPWFWSDGTSFTFTFWCRGQPDFPEIQRCAQMNYSEIRCWDSVQCEGQRPSVCAKESKFLG
ncbi:type-2 ice-structuring protein-like [Betta splendens]|uniref:Type-2 ice-structuring protein-like n=1 Tax=Betta splendens TaxID=158456 RepID=A0A6P7LRE3_BETSP|nr:type-2 ice-structuring protein-like [Betta splendens]XP_028996824.1 type-2 ice-structuring protein-like [Betta splendens]